MSVTSAQQDDPPDRSDAVDVSLRVNRWARVRLSGDPDTASEAWLLLHGYGMTARGISHWFRSAERPGRLMVAPEGLSRFYQGRRGMRTVGASWMTSDDRLHEIDDQLEYLDRVAERWLAGRNRIELHGFSQGTATACRWAVKAPVPIDRLVCWGSSTPPDLATAQLAELVASGCELVIVIGMNDTMVPPDRVVADAERLRAAGVRLTLHRFDGGHEIDATLLSRLSG